MICSGDGAIRFPYTEIYTAGRHESLPEKGWSMKSLEICEHISSIWSYHLSDDGGRTAICGNTLMMPTSLRLETWGMKSPHIPEKYCLKCKTIADARKVTKEFS